MDFVVDKRREHAKSEFEEGKTYWMFDHICGMRLILLEL